MKHLLSIADLSTEEVWELLDLAKKLKGERGGKGNAPLLAGKVLGMVFQKPSLRTRVSFEVAMSQLGGQALYLSPEEIQLGKRESVKDVARVLSRYADGIMARVFAHSDVVELAEHSRVPVINGLSDYEHPCQALADLLTIQERFGELRGVKLAYVGDSNNVLNSLLFAASLVGMDIAVASPAGYEPREEVLDKADTFAKESGTKIEVGPDPQGAVKAAQVVYTDTWVSMGQEAEAQERGRAFLPFQVNSSLVARAGPGAMVMHCLPAHRGQEITDEVLDGPQSAVYDQAENRLHAQKAVLVKLLGQ